MVHVDRFALLGLLLLASPALAQTASNFLRNPDFQDDWATALPQSKTLHWSYSYDYQNRRDYNPDGWTLKGSWEWRDADAPAGERRLIVRGPGATLSQRVNWVAVHDERTLEGFPDAGGFPALAAVRSRRPLGVVRDLSFRVRVKGEGVPADAGSIEVALCPAGKPSPADPLGEPTEPVAAAAAPLPSGTFDWRWVEVKLPAEAWQSAAQAAAEKDAGEAAQAQAKGLVLPASVRVVIRYRAKSGELQIGRAELSDGATSAANLLPNGGFEEKGGGELPLRWEGPEKYTYFPPGRYYLFNTWHNEGFANRGRPAVDSLVVHDGRASLRLPALAGDELAVRSAPIALHQKEARLIEVVAWVKTDRVNQIQIDAVDDKGERLDGFDFIHKALMSIGTDDWRQVRQVFRPRAPLESIRILLCTRGVNGYTLGGTGPEPQNNAAGTVWWDDVRVSELESTAEELAARGLAPVEVVAPVPGMYLSELDLGERLIGDNLLSATLENPGSATTVALELETVSPQGTRRKFAAAPQSVRAGERVSFRLPYRLDEPSPAYTEYRAELRVVDRAGKALAVTDLAFATWTAPVALELGALFLRPEQTKELVRLNLGLSGATMARVSVVRLELVRRRSGEALLTKRVAADREAIRRRRERIPRGLRGDFTNLVLADLDVSKLPVEPFESPERRWLVRATVLDRQGRPLASASSAPFCRQGHPAAQPPIEAVSVEGDLLRVNGKAWIPWGGDYGFVPRYAGPADPPADAVRDLHDLPPWSYYEGFTSGPYNRKDNDLTSRRDFPGYDAVTNPATVQRIEERWKNDNLYTATFFVVPSPGVFSPGALADKAGGAAKLDEYLRFAAAAPMVVSVGPGFEESFGRFHVATPAELAGLEKVVDLLRERTRKPVMVGHGGAWNRFEFEKVPYFNVYDPETEPLFPADLHTDLRPLLEGKNRAIWLRPQMYESVPYERWRFHVFVELMRGARGWQFAHGPADASTLRGLHGEVEVLRPVLGSADPGPAVEIDPPIERWSRRHANKTYVIAATTHAQAMGAWRWSSELTPEGRRSRVSDAPSEIPAENALDRIVNAAHARWIAHALDALPIPPRAEAGARLVQEVRLDPSAPPRSLALLVKIDGRWRSAAWGPLDLEAQAADPSFGYWFLRHFYRNAVGFIGYDGKGLTAALSYVPTRSTAVAPLPQPGKWVRLEAPIEAFLAAGRSIEGVAFLHDGGRVFWGSTSLVRADGSQALLWGNSLAYPTQALSRVRVKVPGLESGAKVRVLFEDREIIAERGSFVDDFRGEDLYQRYGGAEGYGHAPVALHVYEVPEAPAARQPG